LALTDETAQLVLQIETSTQLVPISPSPLFA
jgi:hypothetical protein